MSEEPFIQMPGEGRVLDMGPFRMRVRADSGQTGVPAGVEHGFRVGRMHSRKLNLYLPAAMVGYFEEITAAQGAGSPMSDEELTDAAARHAMRVLGPVPEGYV